MKDAVYKVNVGSNCHAVSVISLFRNYILFLAKIMNNNVVVFFFTAVTQYIVLKASFIKPFYF